MISIQYLNKNNIIDRIISNNNTWYAPYREIIDAILGSTDIRFLNVLDCEANINHRAITIVVIKLNIVIVAIT